MLKPSQDAYGQMVFQHLEGRQVEEVVERDDGFVDVSTGAPLYFAPFDRWPGWEREAMDYVRGRVLDVGCGAGRCALHLQERGHDVLATDISPLAIKTCRRRGVKHARVVPITQLGRALGVFDTILMMGNNFGLFGTPARTRWLLRRFRKMTSPEARIVAESTDPYKTNDPDHLAYHRLNRQRGRMPGQLRLRVLCRKFRTPWFDYLFVSREEMAALVDGTGWRVATYIDSPTATYVGIIEKEEGGAG